MRGSRVFLRRKRCSHGLQPLSLLAGILTPTETILYNSLAQEVDV